MWLLCSRMRLSSVENWDQASSIFIVISTWLKGVGTKLCSRKLRQFCCFSMCLSIKPMICRRELACVYRLIAENLLSVLDCSM